MTLLKPESAGYRYYSTPTYPDVPYAEAKARIDRAQKLMAEQEVDCLALWSRKNIRYFFGFQSIHWKNLDLQPAIGILPVTGEPVLIVPELFRGTVESLCWTRNIWCQKNPHQPRSERELPCEVAGMIEDLGYGAKNIGLEQGQLGCMTIPRPLNDIDAFRNALPRATFVDGDRVVWGCRMFKSPLEVERIRAAVAANGAIMSALVEEFRPGMTEVDISKIVQTKAGQLGTGYLGDGMGLMGSFRAALDKEPMADIGVHEGAAIGKGDYILYDMTFEYKGYCPDQCRIFQISHVTDRVKHLYELIWKCEDAAQSLLKPGVTAKELYRAMYDPLRAEGLPVLDMGGHGTGLDTHEPPSIDAWNEMTIEEGMVLSIEPWLFEYYKMLGGDGKFGIQDQFVVTANGCEKIAGLRRDIIQVSHPIL